MEKKSPSIQKEDRFAKDLDRYYKLKNANDPQRESFLKTLIVRYPQESVLYQEMGYFFLNLKDYSQALFYFQRAQVFNANDGKLYLQIGYLFDLLKNKEEAIKSFEKAAAFPDAEISSQALIALKNLKGEEDKKGSEEVAKTGLDLFYEWKEKDEIYACEILSNYLIEKPDDLVANKEMAYLQLKKENLEWALYYFEKVNILEPCKPEVVIQIATLLYKVKLNQSATRFITRYIHSSHGEERKKYCEVRRNLISEYARLLPKPYFLEIGFNPIYFNRFHNLVNYFYSRLGVTFGPQDNFEFYLKTYITRDTRSNTTGLPQIFADNVWVNSIGLRNRPFKHFPYVGIYAEVGEAYDLEPKDRPRWRGDFRTGGFFYRSFEPPPLCSPCIKFSLRPFSDFYADMSYYSRYQNWIGYGRVRPGVILLEIAEASIRGYARGFIGWDSKKEYFNNFVEVGPGLSFHPTDLLNFAIRWEWIRGYYILVDSPSINPYGNRYYDSRVQVDYYVVF